MENTGADFRGFQVVAPGDIRRLKNEFKSALLPLAHSLKIVPKSDGPQQVFDRFAKTIPGDLKSGEPSEIAASHVGLVAGLLQIASSLERTDPNSDWASYASKAGGLMTHTYGYLCALEDNRRATVMRGAKGRKLIGATSREKTRRAAQKYRGMMSKENAAHEMSDEIGLSAGRIKKLLSDLYPGDAWKNDWDTSQDA